MGIFSYSYPLLDGPGSDEQCGAPPVVVDRPDGPATDAFED